MGKYDNRNLRGIVSSTSYDPRAIEQDIDRYVRNLSPYSTPIQTIGKYIGKGAKPKNWKIETVQNHEFDNLDLLEVLAYGKASDSEDRFVRVRPKQISRPVTGAQQMYYQSGDKFTIAETGQVLEVFMTENDSFAIGKAIRGSIYGASLTEAFVTGSGTGTKLNSKPGEIILRNTEPYPIIPFSSPEAFYMGRSIYESADIETNPTQSHFIYDCNFVEHKEATISMTQDQKEWIQTKWSMPAWDLERKRAFEEFNVQVEEILWFGKKSVDTTNRDRIKHHLQGIIPSITDNIAYYNPFSASLKFEDMFSNFLYYQAFKYNPNGLKKIAFVGPSFLYKFNQQYKDYRRTTSIDIKEKSVGVDIDSYHLPGGFQVSLIRNDLFRIGTPYEHYCVVMDPKEFELRLVKDVSSTLFNAGSIQRDVNLMMEWKGTIAMHRTQSCAILRPF